MKLYTVSYYNERCQDAGDTIKAESLRDACEKVRDLWLGDYAYAYVYELGNEDDDMIATVFPDSTECPEVEAYYAGVNPYGLTTKSDTDHVCAFSSVAERAAFVDAADMEREALTRKEAIEQFGETMVKHAEYLLSQGIPQGLGGLQYLAGMD